MKLLLTSNGLSNKSIADTLFDLVGKKPEETIVTFIPTSANASSNDKGWLIDDLQNIYKQGLKKFTITDISALPKDEWLPRIEEADVLFFSGGDTNYLLDWIEKTGLKELLPDLLKTRVWAGISAGGMVTNPTLSFGSEDMKMYYEGSNDFTSRESLNFVDFYVRPHFNSEVFPKVTIEYMKPLTEVIKRPVYLLDDQSAVKVDGDHVEVISEGEYYIFNQ